MQVTGYGVQNPGLQFESIKIDLEEISSTEVLIDVTHCGICHSDLSMAKNEWQITTYPLIPGHEVVGTISQLGSNVRGFEVGDTVGLGWHSDYCMACKCCESGDHNLCSESTGTIVGRHGGFAERVKANAASVVKIPDGLDHNTIGPLLCGGITVFSPLVEFGIKPTDRVGVIGIGGLGSMAIQFLSAWGCEVTAFTSSKSKIEAVKKLGARHSIDSRDPNQLELVESSFDFLISTVNVKLDWGKYISALKPKGRLHFVGATLDPLDISVMPLLAKQRSISGSPVGSPSTIKKMLDFVVRHQINPLVEVFPMDKVNEAVAHLEAGKARYRVVLKR